MRAALLALPLVAACASDGSPVVGVPPVETRCAGYATALTLFASVAEINDDTRRNASITLAAGTVAGCSGPAWETAVETWQGRLDG